MKQNKVRKNMGKQRKSYKKKWQLGRHRKRKRRKKNKRERKRGR